MYIIKVKVVFENYTNQSYPGKFDGYFAQKN